MERKILKLGDSPGDDLFYRSHTEPRTTAGVVHPAASTGSRFAGEQGATILCNVPFVEVHLEPKSRLFFHTEPCSSASDRYRFLRMRLREFKAKLKLKTVLVTSPNPGDGKSTTVANLATALADRGRSRVLVVEADLYHASLVELVGVRPAKGLGEILEHSITPFAGIRRLEPLGWYLLGAGQTSITPTELLGKESFSQVIQELTPHFDWVLIDSPPVIPLVDTLLLKSSANATLLVARAGHTPRKAIEKSLSLLGKEHVLGVVLNAAEDVNHLYSKYSKYYGRYRAQNAASK
jgi:capsular exopolysaccharide synthesis family protein